MIPRETEQTRGKRVISPEAKQAINAHATMLITNNRTHTMGKVLERLSTLILKDEVEEYVKMLDLGQEKLQFDGNPEMQKLWDAVDRRLRQNEIFTLSAVVAMADVLKE